MLREDVLAIETQRRNRHPRVGPSAAAPRAILERVPLVAEQIPQVLDQFRLGSGFRRTAFLALGRRTLAFDFIKKAN